MLAGDPFQLRILNDHRLRNDQFAHQIDEAVELVCVDPNDPGSTGYGGLFCLRCSWQRGFWECLRVAQFWLRLGLACRRNCVGWSQLDGRVSLWRQYGRNGGGTTSIASEPILRCQYVMHPAYKPWNGERNLSPGIRTSELAGELCHVSFQNVGPLQNQVDRLSAQLKSAPPGSIQQ